MTEPNLFFHNSFAIVKEKVFILSSNDNYASNFGKQWKKYQNIQIDSINNFGSIIYKYYIRCILLLNNIKQINYLK